VAVLRFKPEKLKALKRVKKEREREREWFHNNKFEIGMKKGC
jgi:hypothetical protein